MVKESSSSSKDRDRPRSKTTVRSRSKEEDRKVSKEYAAKTSSSSSSSSEVRKQGVVAKSESSKVSSSSKEGSSTDTAAGSKPSSSGDRIAPPPPPILDKKEIYENVIKHEAEVAAEADLSETARDFMEASEELQDVMQDIYELKIAKNVDEDEVDELKTEGLLLLNKIRHLNRLSKLRLKAVKDDAINNRQIVDRNHLLLQNLLYEATHLKKQVEAVQEYKGQDEEIDLIPVDKFYQIAPAKIANPEVTKVNDHYLRIARLEHEFILRQELTNNCGELEKTKDTVAHSIESSRRKLDSIRPLLHAVLESTKPVQEFFGMNVWKEQKELQTSYLLPIPLYCLFIQSSAYKDTLKSNGCEFLARICGDVEAARDFIDDTAEDDEPEEDSDSDMEQDVDDNDAGDTGLPSRRKSRKGSANRAGKINPRKKLVQKHPLWVDWILRISSGETIIISFHYATKLQVVTVKSMVELGVFSDRIIPSALGQSDSILTDLFPDDTGMECPNPTNFYHLRKADVEDFAELVDELGRPYVWAQKVCGLNFPPIIKHLHENAPKPENKQLRTDVKYSSMKIEKTVQTIFERLKSQAALWFQVKSLDSRSVTIPPETRRLFPKKISTNFVSWEYYSHDRMPSMLSRALVRNRKFNISAELKDLVFKAFVERGRVKMHAFVIIGMNYPTVPPVFLLVMEKDGMEQDAASNYNLKDLEKEINLHAPLEFEQYTESLLLLQIYRMMSDLDALLEAENLSGDIAGPLEFGRDKIFTSAARGRNCRRPLRYLPTGSGVFTHRF